MADRDFTDYLEWTPFVGGLAYTATEIGKEGVSEVKDAFNRGERAGRQVRRLGQYWEQERLLRDKGFPAEVTSMPFQEMVIEGTHRALGTSKRLGHIKNFADAYDYQTTMPEFYREATRRAWSLKNIDPTKFLTEDALAKIVQPGATMHWSPPVANQAALLKAIERQRGPGFKEPFINMMVHLQSSFGSKAQVSVGRMIEEGKAAGEMISLRLAVGGIAIELPVMTKQGLLHHRTGTNYIPYHWETGTEQIAPDTYIMQRLAEQTSNLPGNTQERGRVLKDLANDLKNQAIFDYKGQPRAAVGISQQWRQQLVKLVGEDQQDILRQREKLVQAGQATRIVGTSASAPTSGVAFGREAQPWTWSSSGMLEDEKLHKTFARDWEVAQESKTAITQALEQGRRGKSAAILLPREIPGGVFNAMEQANDNLLNLTYGVIPEDDLKKFTESFSLSHKGKHKRRLQLATMHDDELVLSHDMMSFGKMERRITYKLDPKHVYESMQSVGSGGALKSNMVLGLDPQGHPVYAGRRGGQDFLERLVTETVDDQTVTTAYVRNVHAPGIGTKIFGTGGLKHVVRQLMGRKGMQKFYADYLMNTGEYTQAEAGRLAGQIQGLTVRKGYKTYSQEVDQYLRQLVSLQIGAENKGLDLADEAAAKLSEFGYERKSYQLFGTGKATTGWIRTNFDLHPKKILEQFEAGTSGPLAEAVKRSKYQRIETFNFGPSMSDQGVGGMAKISPEMITNLADLETSGGIGLGDVSMELLARSGTEGHQTLQGLTRMLEPYNEGVTRSGLSIDRLTADQLSQGEMGLSNWLSPRNPNFPKGGVITHAPYELEHGRTVSYLQLPDQPLESLRSLFLDDGTNAASELQKKFHTALTKVHADLNRRPGTQSYKVAQQALQEYYNLLAQLTVGKKGALRNTLGGKVRGSMIFQAATPVDFSQVIEPFADYKKFGSKANASIDRVGTTFMTNADFGSMVGNLARPELETLLGHMDPTFSAQGKALTERELRQGLMKQFGSGRMATGISARYPMERSLSAVPVHFRSMNWALAEQGRQVKNMAPHKTKKGTMYIASKQWEISGGDFDADTLHAFLITQDSNLKKGNDWLGEHGKIAGWVDDWRTSLKQNVKTNIGRNWTDEYLAAWVKRQEVGKVSIGSISNELARIRAGVRMAHTEDMGDLNKLIGWTEVLSEGVTIKAKQTGLEAFQGKDAEMMLAQLKGEGIGLTYRSRAETLVRGPKGQKGYFQGVVGDDLIKQLQAQNPGKTIDEITAMAPYQSLLDEHVGNISKSLELADKVFKGSAWEDFQKTLKTSKAQATIGGAVDAVQKAYGVFNDHLLSLVSSEALDSGSLRSQARNRLAGVTSAARQAGQLLNKHGKWGLYGLAGATAIAMLRAPKPLTPEQVNGSDLADSGALTQGNVTMDQLPRPHVTPRNTNRQVRVEGRATQGFNHNQLGYDLANNTGSSQARVVVDDRRRYKDEFRNR
jgi:hypothetical protein